MQKMQLALAVLSGLSSICLSATASANAGFSGQSTLYQDALSDYSTHTECVAYSLTVNIGRSEIHTIGMPPESRDTLYVSYNGADACSGPFVRMTYGTASIEQSVDLDRRLKQGSVDVDVEIDGYDCVQTETSFDCTERSFSFIATVAWTGVGTITHISERTSDIPNGLLFSSYKQDDREAEASFAGLVDGHVFDYTTENASFTRIQQQRLSFTRP